VFTSNAFAILGLRAMYFLLADLMHRFIYLKLGLAMVLIWVGTKMLLLEIYKIPTGLSLAVVALLLAVAVTASWIRTRTRTTPAATAVTATSATDPTGTTAAPAGAVHGNRAGSGDAPQMAAGQAVVPATETDTAAGTAPSPVSTAGSLTRD